MAVKFENGDKVLITSPVYGSLTGKAAVVTDDFSKCFRVEVGHPLGFEIVISDPTAHLTHVTFDVNSAVKALEKLARDLGPCRIEVDDDGSVQVTMNERLLVKTFGDDHGYQMYDDRAAYHLVDKGDVTFRAFVSYRFKDQANAWAAAQLAAAAPDAAAEGASTVAEVPATDAV